MTDRPILFSAQMVRALLEGRKTQTRRVLKPLTNRTIFFNPQIAGKEQFQKPRYTVGDHLWVREACAIVGSMDPGFVLYRADGYEAECERHGFDKPFPPESEARWRPSIHMPRWASRLTLNVIDVRVERLHDISEADAIAEGVTRVREACHVIRGFDYDLSGLCHTSAITPFLKLWNHINGPDACESNPWVAAYTFHVINRNIDRIEVAS